MVEGRTLLPRTQTPTLPGLVHAVDVHQASNGGSPTIHVCQEADSTSWRAVAAQLYTALGAPTLPGYTREHIHRVLSGTMALDPEFSRALVTGCRALPGREQAAPDGMAARHGPGRLLRRITRRAQERGGPGRIARTPYTIDTAGVPTPTSGAGAPRDAGTGGDNGSRGSAPFPQQAVTPAQFAAGLRAVKQWSGLSLRQLEQRAQLQGGWLPRSSISDMLRRESVPKADALDALICALGLSPEERECWQALREAIACPGTVSNPEARPMPTRRTAGGYTAPECTDTRTLPSPIHWRRSRASTTSPPQPPDKGSITIDSDRQGKEARRDR